MHQVLVDTNTLQRAIEYFVHRLVGDVGNGCLQVALVLMQDGVNLPEYHLVLILSKGYDTAIVDALLRVGNDLRHINLVDIA